MPKSANIAKYPSGMIEVLESVCYTGKQCEIEYPDTAAARRERFQFYGLVRALKIQQHSLAPLTEQLTFSIGGKDSNVLTIAMGHIIKSDFYSKVAEQHRAVAPNLGPTAEQLAVAAVVEQQNKEH